MDNRPTAEPESESSIAGELGNDRPWKDNGLNFAVAALEVGSVTNSAAIEVPEGGWAENTDDADRSRLPDRPNSLGLSRLSTTIVDIVAPAGCMSYATDMRKGPAAGTGVRATDTDAWAACALACCWPLVRSAEVHFTTNIPQKVLTGALRIYLQIQPDELLLAIIDRSGGRSPAWGCALTTRRLHWAGRSSASFTLPHPGLAGQPRPPLGRAIAYADLTEITRDGILFSGVESGTQDRLSFGPHGIGVPEVLVDVLKISSMFLHLGFLHLVFNMWCLLWFGPLVERLFGSLGFAALYLLSGLGGSIASLWYHPMVISAGASGAIFGIFGGLIGYLIVRRDVSPGRSCSFSDRE